VVRTTSVDAVTRLDVELAHRVDAAILEAGAGMA
jgi:pterin-4a-carbinolamine dehydratase